MPRGGVWQFARAAVGRALLATLRTVAGREEAGALLWTGSWTELSVQQCDQGHRRHGSVVSVQVVRTMHRAVLLIIRRSWVRAPPAPPGFTCVKFRTMPSGTGRLHRANALDNVRGAGPAAAEVPGRHRLGSDVVHDPVAADAQPPSGDP
jgi:hypothetical protein